MNRIHFHRSGMNHDHLIQQITYREPAPSDSTVIFPIVDRIILSALLILLWSIFITALGQSQKSDDFHELPSNQSLEREMTGAETHRYKVALKVNEFFQVRVEQKGVDVALKLSDANGNVLATMDSPNDKVGPETLTFVAAKAGGYALQVSSTGPTAEKGSYTIRREAPRTATSHDKRRVAVERLFVEGMTARATNGQAETAIKIFSEAHAGWEELADTYMAELTAQQVKQLRPSRATVLFDEAMVLRRAQSAEAYRVALEKFQEASRLYHDVGDKTGEAQSLVGAGFIAEQLGESTITLNFYGQALLLFRSSKNNRGEAVTLNNIGLVYSRLGDQQRALDHYNQALPLLKAVGFSSGELMTLSNIGKVYADLGEYQSALNYLNQALSLRKVVGYKGGEAATLNNMGSIYSALGERQKALGYYNQALLIVKTDGDKSAEAVTLNNIGLIYSALGERQRALEYFNQALPLLRAVGNRDGEALTLNNIGALYDASGEKQKALEFYNKAMPLFKAVGDKRGEAVALNNIGRVYDALGDLQRSLDYYNQAMPLRRVVGDKVGEATTLSNEMFVWQLIGNRRLAIFYGKQAVNKYQELRQAIRGLEQETQKAFLGTIEVTYRKLSDLLIAEGRILEAEQVLAMLKQEEVFDYLRRDASEIDKLQQRADLTKQEADALKRYNEIADNITKLGVEFGNLQELQSKGIKLTAEQEKRYADLSTQIEDVSRSFQVFLRQLAEEFAKRVNVEIDMQENLSLKSDLKSWGKGVVFLYTLVGEDRYRVILVTPDTQVDGKSEIKVADLNDKIEKFRAAVQDPKTDSRPLGKELYDILIKPVEKQLDGAKAKTLLWSLDGSLRLLPISALWDGKQYFGQKYQNVTVTLASRTRLGDAVAPNWRALGLGVSEAKTVKEPNGTREFTFPSLPSVRAELGSIVQSAQSPNGVMPGQSLIDADFSEPALETQLLHGYKVIHIASHFSLNPGDSTRSFLLLGDGNVLTVDNIRNNPKLSFSGVELLTLSACQTAVVEKDSSGKEIEGFGYVAQQKGAKAILATLWSVADESTQLLMSEFYRLRKKNPKLTKAAALQMAQKEMIAGKLKASVRTGARRKTSDTVDTSEVNTAPPDYSHPYYWSPFVLIGNWR